MGRFETELLATDANVGGLTDMSGAWIDKVHDRRPPKMIILDMDSSVNPTHGDQKGIAYNGFFNCTCYHTLFLFKKNYGTGRLTSKGRFSNSHPSMPMGYQWIAV